jgi:hypothetical protein
LASQFLLQLERSSGIRFFMNRIVVIGALVGLVWMTVWGRPAMAERVAEPAYTVMKKSGDVELRRYAPVVRAVTVVSDVGWDQALNEGFRRLAGYIFGGNTRRQSIAMTAPVTAQPASSSMQIAMTAPVTAQPAARGVRVTFTMPAEHTLATLPTPQDRSVTLEAVDERLVAVRRFSGFASAGAFERERTALRNGLSALGVVAVGEVELARYDPPWTLPFLRRNEVAVDVEQRLVH